jgi:hypothetical protein
MAALAACLLTGFSIGQDYLDGGHVQSSRGTSDPGLAGMLRWLDQPVTTFPWYTDSTSTDGRALYQQGVPETTFTPFKEYYTPIGQPVVQLGQGISTPFSVDLSKRTPAYVYYGTGQGLPYSQYAALTPSRTNDLWIQGTGNWTQYVAVPIGTQLKLIANVPVAGPGGFYEVVQTGTPALNYNTYQFLQGYNTMTFNAGQAGRHMLYYVVNNQPSDVVIIDVFAQD